MPKIESHPAGAPCWIDVMTPDADGARTFYGELLGWTSEQTGPEFGGYINFLKDGVRIAGGMQNDGSAGMFNAWTVYLATDDAQATVDKAVAAGGQVASPPMAVGDLGTMATIIDPGGAFLGIWQPGTHKGFQVLAEPGAPAWFELHTHSYDASVTFYREVFGWDTHAQSDTDEFRYTTLGEGEDQKAGIMDDSVMGPSEGSAFWTVYFAVDDADKAVAKVEQLGGKLVNGPDDTPYGRLSVVTDPAGVEFRLITDNA